jgi:hypothetical protein
MVDGCSIYYDDCRCTLAIYTYALIGTNQFELSGGVYINDDDSTQQINKYSAAAAAVARCSLFSSINVYLCNNCIEASFFCCCCCCGSVFFVQKRKTN